MAKDTDSLLNGCLFFTANKLARAITRMAEEEFQTTGFAPTYGFLLMVVEQQPGINPSELGEQLFLTPSTITRLLDKLEHKGLIIREADGKKFNVRLTAKGAELLPEVRKSWRSLHARYAALLGGSESKTLNAAVLEAAEKLQ